MATKKHKIQVSQLSRKVVVGAQRSAPEEHHVYSPNTLMTLRSRGARCTLAQLHAAPDGAE